MAQLNSLNPESMFAQAETPLPGARRKNKRFGSKAKVLRCHHRHTLHVRRVGGVACQWGMVHHGGWLISWWGGISLGGGLTLVLTWLMTGGGGWGKPKVVLLAKPLELQYYFAPFSNSAK